MNSLDLITIIVQDQNIIASPIDDEVVMANLKTDKYYGLNPVSTRIWHLLEEPQRLSDLCDVLMSEFDVDEATCQTEVLSFTQALYDAEMVTIVAADA